MAALPHLDFAPLLAGESENEEFDVFAAGAALSRPIIYSFTLSFIHSFIHLFFRLLFIR